MRVKAIFAFLLTIATLLTIPLINFAVDPLKVSQQQLTCMRGCYIKGTVLPQNAICGDDDCTYINRKEFDCVKTKCRITIENKIHKANGRCTRSQMGSVCFNH